MRLRRSRALLAVAGLLLAAGAFFGVRHFRTRIVDRVYVIGWQNVPPFQQKAEDGSPAGLAVDLVREAARRRGIRLQWVWHPASSEEALRSRQVDLWPLITIMPERLQHIHISKPYLRHDYALLTPANSNYRQISDLASARISHLALTGGPRLLTQTLPGARLVPAPSQRDAIREVCAGAADAAFMDEFTATAQLLSGDNCESRPLRLIPLPALRGFLGVGSTPESSAVADAIRDAIDLSEDGNLPEILRKSGYFSSRNLDYFTFMLEAQQRERLLIGMILLFAIFLAVTVYTADRIRRQRNRIAATERALRESEHKLRALTNNLGDVVLAYDMDRRLVFANPALERVSGYSVEEFGANGFICWAHPEDRQRMNESWEQLFRGVGFRDQEYRVLTSDGRVRWVTATWGPMYDDAGHQIGVQGVEHDITVRRLAEESLRESERRFRESLEHVQLVAIITDANGNITFCNQHTLSLTGWSVDEMFGHPAPSFIDGDFLMKLEDAAAGRNAGPFECAILAKDGTRRSIEWASTPVRDSLGRHAGFASLGADVTELRALRAEAARRESEERFRTIADTAPLMIWVTGTDGGCTFVNKGWLAFTGAVLEDQLDLGWLSAVHPDDRPSWFDAYSAAFDRRRSFQFETRMRQADGEYRWVLFNGAPRYLPDGEFAGFVGNCNDISDLKRSRDESVARQKLETVGRLAAGVAHDFNNLLGGILAQADLGLAEIAGGSSPDQVLRHIGTVAVRGAGIVRQLMIYSGQDSPAVEPVDVSALVQDMIDLLGVVVSKHAALRTELLRNPPLVQANPAQLRQVAMNLVTNASEAIGEHDGVITIRTASAGGGRVLLEVEDTGCGLTPEVQGRLFEPFFTTKPTGHGLGLAVVQRIVQSLGGEIRFVSAPGHGAVFRVLLPVSHAAARPPAPGRHSRLAESPNLQGTVLVVEDEEMFRSAVAKMLRIKGMRVIEAGDGDAALQLVRDGAESISVVLLDITLPGATSREVFAETRRLRPQTKIVLTSAYTETAWERSDPRFEFDAFIRKPYHLQDLLALLRRFAGAAQKTTASAASSESY